MKEIKFSPVGRVYLSPVQQRDEYIKQLQHWVIALGLADIIFSVLVVALLCEVIQ